MYPSLRVIMERILKEVSLAIMRYKYPDTNIKFSILDE
jgi:hypothetical protein